MSASSDRKSRFRPAFLSASPRTEAFLRRYGGWLALVIASAAYFPRFIAGTPHVLLYPLAGQCMLAQQPLLVCAPGFTYPPFFAFVLIPLAGIAPWAWNILWYLITLAGTVISFWLADAMALAMGPSTWPESKRVWLRLLGGLLSIKFVLAVYENQAYDLVALPFALFGIYAMTRDWDKRAGAALAIAAALKVTPLIFLPYLIMRRRFMAAAAFVGVLLIACFLPDILFTQQGSADGYLVTWLKEIAGASLTDTHSSHAFWAGANLLNHSIHGMVARYVEGTSWQDDFGLILHLAQFGFVAIVSILLLLSARSRWTIPIDGSLLIIAALMLSPMSSRSHFVGLLLPNFIAVACWLWDSRTRFLGAVVLAASFVLASATSNDFVGKTINDWAYRTGLIEWGSMVLIVYFGVLVWHARRAEVGIRP